MSKHNSVLFTYVLALIASAGCATAPTKETGVESITTSTLSRDSAPGWNYVSDPLVLEFNEIWPGWGWPLDQPYLGCKRKDVNCRYNRIMDNLIALTKLIWRVERSDDFNRMSEIIWVHRKVTLTLLRDLSNPRDLAVVTDVFDNLDRLDRFFHERLHTYLIK